jgi:RNA polymerase sigma-70 factor (ECF subfamily)
MDERTERRAEAAYAEFRRTRGPRAMAEVFDLTAGELLLFARRLAKDAAVAEDLVQQTFVRAIERAEQFDASRRLLPWLTAILANEARMVHRRGEPDVARVRVPEVVDPQQEAARREAQRALDAAFAELPADQRDVIAMRHLHGMPPRHIAAALAIPVATVKTRLRRGVERLAASLPPGLAFATAFSLLAGRGMAATRRAVQVHAGELALSTSVSSLWGVVTMKKVAFVLGAALVLLASLPLWWNHEPPTVGAPADGAVALAATARGAVDVPSPTGSAERTAIVDPAKPAPAPEEVVAVDLFVRAVWKQSRQPAARVPLALLVQPRDLLANLWTDHAGKARFALSVPARHWLAGIAERNVSVTTALRPGYYFNLALTADPDTLEVEIDDGQHVAGSVVDTAGNPVVGADVRLASSQYPDVVVARSDAAGAFELAGLPAGFVLRASAGTMESAPATITDLAGGERLVLRLDGGGDNVQIRVVAQGQPVADATVRLDTGLRRAPQRQFIGSTDAEGSATFAGLPADGYVVEVVHRAHPPAQRRITTEGLGMVRVETIGLGESASLVGIVRRGGRPATGVRVMLEQANSLFYRDCAGTDRDGRFIVDRLAVGTHEVWFAQDTTSEWRNVTLHAGEQSVEFNLPGGTDIAGRLLLPDGSPALRWNVAAQRTDEMAWSSRVVTDANGKFAFENLPAETYRLVATGPEGGGHTFFDVHTDGKVADYRLPTTALWRPATIAGRFENPPPDATLWTSDERDDGGHGSQLGADGAIALGPLAPGRYRVWLEKNDIVLWLTQVDLVSAQTMDLGVVPLPRCGALAVTVRGAAGVDAASAGVLLRSSVATDGYSFGPRPQLGADGAWHCEHIPAGSWWLVVAGDGIAPDVRQLSIEPDSTRRVEVVLAPSVPIEFHFAVGAADAPAVGWRRETVRRVGDRAIVSFQQIVGALHTRVDLAPGSYTIDVETGGGFYGTATFEAPAQAPVEVPLARR